jgi:phage terminase large subunit-like protein
MTDKVLDLILAGCRCTSYAQAVVDGRIHACRWVKLSCERHLRDLERDDVWFDQIAADKFYNYCTYLKHYKGPMRGLRIELSDWQCFVFGSVYGWKQILRGQKTDQWRFHYVYIEVPRKNGKSTIAAACASYDCNMVEDTGAEVYLAATKEEQAKIVYNDVQAFIKGSAELSQEFEILAGRSTIYTISSERTSFIKPLGSNSEKLDGLNPISVVCDEVHEFKDTKLWDVLEDAFGARDNWHMIAITTAGYNKEGICWQERENLIDILEQRVDRDDKFGVIYTVDEDMKEEWTLEEQWFIANPELGKGKQLDYMQSIAQKAEQMPSKINSFKNKQLNIWTDVAECWLKYDSWKACALTFDWEKVRGKKCKAGMDLARVNDLSAVAYWFPVQPGLDKPHLLVDFYHPEDNLRERQDNDKVPYDLWVERGYITATPGNTTDFAFIKHDILKRATMVDIEELAYDRHFGGEIVNALQEEEVNLVEFGMGYVSMGAPTAELERMVVAMEFHHNNNPVLNWNAANVVVRRDPAGNIKPDKDLSQKRIDGIVATIMAVGRQMNKEHTKKKSPYGKRGMRVLTSDDEEKVSE